MYNAADRLAHKVVNKLMTTLGYVNSLELAFQIEAHHDIGLLLFFIYTMYIHIGFKLMFADAQKVQFRSI